MSTDLTLNDLSTFVSTAVEPVDITGDDFSAHTSASSPGILAEPRTPPHEHRSPETDPGSHEDAPESSETDLRSVESDQIDPQQPDSPPQPHREPPQPADSQEPAAVLEPEFRPEGPSRPNAELSDSVPGSEAVNEDAVSSGNGGTDASTDGDATRAAKTGFQSLELKDEIHQALVDRGYTQPTPIQAETIPHLLAGRDVFGQAQTGTGKTAAFALPLLSRLDLSQRDPQVLVLAPTRELALQVSESFERYGAHLDGFRCTAIYGGSDFYPQIRDLRRGVHVVVGTPGRVIDHMKRGTLRLNELKTIVLDEADEMLRMGFVDDVTWVLLQTPERRQVALFSATLPEPIRRIAREHQNDPKEIRIESEVRTAETVRQRSLIVNWRDKVDALARILEVEPTDGVIVFVSTKSTTTELSDQLLERGFSATPLNGDIPQNLRERTVEQLKAGRVDVIVATDVAARGLDVSRVSHVINFDMPAEPESYVHRIGRTGRAGRSGEAILFVKPQERRHVRRIEQSTGQRIEPMRLPTVDAVNEVRLTKFKKRITQTLEAGELEFFTGLINQYQQETNTPPWQVAAALAKLLQGDTPLLMKEPPRQRRDSDSERRRGRQADSSGNQRSRSPRDRNHGERPARPDEGMERFRIEVGLTHGVRPGNIVGAIANEAGLAGNHIGRVTIFDEFSTVDLPVGMPREIFQRLKQTWVSGRQLRISRINGQSRSPAPRTNATGDGAQKKRRSGKLKRRSDSSRKNRRQV